MCCKSWAWRHNALWIIFVVLMHWVSAGPTKDGESTTHMQLDGEPWPQAIPAGEKSQPLTVWTSLPRRDTLDLLLWTSHVQNLQCV